MPTPAFVCSRQNSPTGMLRPQGLFAPRMAVRLQATDATQLILSHEAAYGWPNNGQRCHIALSLPDVGFVEGTIALAPRPGPVRPGARCRTQAFWVRPSVRLLTLLGQYLLLHGHGTGAAISPLSLRRAGLGFVAIAPCMRYGEVHTASDMGQVLHLRFRVFAEAQMLKPNQRQVVDLWDARDDEGHIMVARYRGVIVGTCRATPLSAHSELDFDPWVPDTSCLPPRHEMLEMSRGAIAMPYRGTDIAASLIRRSVAVAVRTNKRYMVLGTYADKVAYYGHFGFEPTAITYRYPGMPDSVAHVLVADLQAIWRGHKGGPMLWHALFSDLNEHLPRGPFMPTGWLDMAKIAALRRLQPVCQSIAQLDSWRRNARAHVRA